MQLKIWPLVKVYFKSYDQETFIFVSIAVALGCVWLIVG